MRNQKNSTIKIGISSCLLGLKVRFDGGHKKDDFVTGILNEFVRFIPVCPELEVGMGVPRESVRLEGNIEKPLMISTKSGIDWTIRMNKYSLIRVNKNDIRRLSGFILKKKSPSCGMERVKVYNEKGMPTHLGVGLFAKSLLEKYPSLPIEEEGRLQDAKLRENFIIRIFAYNRLQKLYARKFNRNEFIKFHTVHKYLMLSHSPKHYKMLGQMVAGINNYKPNEFRTLYFSVFMEGLKIRATTKKHTNVLQHILGFMKNQLTKYDKSSIINSIDDYHNGLVPLVVPITLIKNYIYKYDIDYIKDQIYLNPHPKEMMLRNHV